MPGQPLRWFRVEMLGEVAVVRFPHQGVLQGEGATVIGEQLVRLVEEEGRLLLLLDLANVECVDSATLGQLLILHHKLLTAGGRLKLCRLKPEVYDTFATTKLPRLFGVYGTEEEALATFGGSTGPTAGEDA